MRLLLADIRLHRARLFGLSPRRPPAYPWTSPRADLAEARKLIETCGYGRRLGELEDAEAALQALSASRPLTTLRRHGRAVRIGANSRLCGPAPIPYPS